MNPLPELRLWRRFNLLAGVDEAGRGPIAGPVVASAVILPKDFYHPEIDDSKKLAAAKREELFQVITKHAVSYTFGIVSHTIIDQINILEATKRAMCEAIDGLVPIPELVLIDALRLGALPLPQLSIVKGDQLSLSIAAASILAKVKRDSIMCDYHLEFPEYNFHQHKGYPTEMHRRCIQAHGPCPIHRMSFKLL